MAKQTIKEACCYYGKHGKDKVTVFGTETHLQLSTCNPYCIDIFTERATYLSDNTEMTQEIFHLAEDHLKKKKAENQI